MIWSVAGQVQAESWQAGTCFSCCLWLKYSRASAWSGQMTSWGWKPQLRAQAGRLQAQDDVVAGTAKEVLRSACQGCPAEAAPSSACCRYIHPLMPDLNPCMSTGCGYDERPQCPFML